MKTRLLTTAFLLFSLHGLRAAAIDANWTSKNVGEKTANATLGPSAISVTHITSPSIGTADFSTSEYSGAPLPPGSSALTNYTVGSNYTATFSLPVSGLLIYAMFWNGNVGGVTPIKYTFSQPFEILSGFELATIAGNTLNLPSFQSGILRFPGPIKQLSVSMNTTNSGGQIMSFGVIPVATALTVTPPLKPTTKKARYTLRGTASATYGIQAVKIKVGGASPVSANGTAAWRYTVKLPNVKPGKHPKKKRTIVRIWPVGNDDSTSATRTVVITRKIPKKK